MFKIKLSPQVRSDVLTISKSGEALSINGESFDFTDLPEGATLPKEAVGCDWIISDVSRKNGDIELIILLPITADATDAAKFPEDLNITDDGAVVLPE